MTELGKPGYSVKDTKETRSLLTVRVMLALFTDVIVDAFAMSITLAIYNGSYDILGVVWLSTKSLFKGKNHYFQYVLFLLPQP